MSSQKFTFMIIMFSMLAMMSIFSIVFIYEIGRTEILSVMTNVSLDIQIQENVSSAMQTHTQDLQNTYNNISIPYDLFFLYLFISTFVTSIMFAVRQRKQSTLEFFGGLFYGFMGLLLIVFFIDQVQDWFFTNIFYAVFNDITLDLPILTFYFDNIGWISALWFVVLLLINKVDFRLEEGRIEA